MLYDLNDLKTRGFPDPSKFKFDGKSWSAWYSKKNSNYLVKNHTDDTRPITLANWMDRVFFSNGEVVYQDTPIYRSKTEAPAVTSLSYEDYKSCLVEDELTQDFLNSMEVENFYEAYKNHPNISTFDFSYCNERFSLNRMYGRRNILFFDNGKEFYAKYKFNPQGGWLNIKGTKNLGSFFQAKDGKSRTLILCEGLKDGINANIAFPSADILVTDGKRMPFKFKKHDINPKKYQRIILAVDRDVTPEEQVKLLRDLNAPFYKKVYSLDWEKIKEDLKDLTEWIRNENLTISQFKKVGLKNLKKFLSSDNFNKIYIMDRNKQLNRIFDFAVRNNDTDSVRRVIKTKNALKLGLSREAKYMFSRRIQDEDIINLNQLGKLSDNSKEIIDIVDRHQKTLLNAPTGTGKSYLVKNIFPIKYSNIIIVTPLRMVTDEISEETLFENVKRIEDINTPYISMTTDIFQYLFERYPEIFKKRVEQSDIVIFDEQHIYKDSQNFRDKVVKTYEYLLYEYKGKALFMSGTPVIPEDIKVKIITAKVPEERKKIITYSKNRFKNRDEMVADIRENIKDGSVMIYCSSKNKVKEVTRLLMENNIDVFSITSVSMRENNKIIKNKRIKHGNYAYISTTKATTGITISNLKGIYQYGTAYNANTFIQLLGRLRDGGFVYYIKPKHEHQQEKFVQNSAIGLAKGFQRLGVKKLSDAFRNPEFEKWIEHNIYIPFYYKELKGFLRYFKDALQDIEAKSLGNYTIERDDFIFNGEFVKDIHSKFDKSDMVNFEKFIDRVVVDWVNHNDIEMLNSIYNLSFNIRDVSYEAEDMSKIQLITDKDRIEKKNLRKMEEFLVDDFYMKMEKKFSGCLTPYLLKKNFTLEELTKIDEMDMDLSDVKSFLHTADKVVRIKAKLIPVEEILDIANKIIEDDDRNICRLKDLDIELQRHHIVKSRSKSVYYQYLLSLFTGGLLDEINSNLKYSPLKKVKNRQYRNVLVKI